MTTPGAKRSFTYPAARREDVVDDYHGTAVADPYRWLEDDQSPETRAWVADQNRLTEAFLSAVAARPRLRARLTELWDYERFSPPVRRGNELFYSRNDGLQNQDVLYRQRGLGGEPAQVIDPNALSPDGALALTTTAYSPDGRLLAYGVSQSGSDWQEISICDVATGRDYDDVIRWCKFTAIAWTPDGSGFYYSRYPAPDEMPGAPPSTHHRLYWHSLGALQSDDRLIYARPDALDLAFDPHISDDGRYVLITVWQGTDVRNRFYYQPLGADGPPIRLLDDADARYSFIGNDGPRFFFHTDLDAPRGRIVAIDVRRPQRDEWQEIVPEQADAIDLVAMIQDRLTVVTLHEAHHRLLLFDLAGRPVGEVALPANGTIVELTGRQQDPDFFFNFQSYLFPPTIYRYDLRQQRLEPFRRPGLAFNPDDFETWQYFYTSKDGTRVPIFVTHHCGLALDGGHPTLLYGYGGFAISQTPTFSAARLAWLESGGLWAEAGLRGGAEYGEEWHQTGMLERKQNVFDDFMAAAEWLVANGYTRRERLAIMGRSNGGLLTAACLTQRPELFGAVISQVPVIDMLRYHRFTAGRYWTPEYGNAEEDADHFSFLYDYSPLHNLRPGVAYPPTLIATGDTDDRVVPLHARKFAAALQAADGGDNPILLRVDVKAGHGLGKPTSKLIEEWADLFAFLFAALGIEG